MKVTAWVRVILHLIVVDGLLRILAKIVFPFAYLLTFAGKWNPLWIFLHPNPYGNKQECWSIVGFEPTNWYKKFILAYYWGAMRNPCWNLQEMLLITGEYSNVVKVYNHKYHYDIPTWKRKTYYYFNDGDLRMCRAKFTQGTDTVISNYGDVLNMPNSIFGHKLYYFTANNRRYVLYSYCSVEVPTGIMKLFFKKPYVREFNVGGASRILIRIKFQKFTSITN